jgi:O-antigen ligase
MTETEFIRGGAGHPASLAAAGAKALLLAGLVIPWLNPYADGPSTWVIPWLLSASCGAIAYGSQRPGSPHWGVSAGLAALAAWALLRSGWTPETLALAGGCVLVWMTVAMASGQAQCPGWVRTAALALLAAATISTFAALCQYFGLADDLAPWVNTSAVGEAFANLRQRNQFASLTVIGMAALLFWLLPGIRRWHAIVAIAWLALGNAVTTSRTGLLQLLLLGLLACVWPGPRWQRARLWAVGLLAYFVAALVLPWVLEASTGVSANHLWTRVAEADGCGSRIVLWSNVLHLIAQKPWLGWGWGELDFAHYATLYAGPRFCDILDNAHNLPLHLAVELGLPAAVLSCVGLCWAAARAEPWRESDPVRQMAWAVLVVIGVHSLLEYPLWYGPFQIALGVCLGLLCRPRTSPAADPVPTPAGHSTAGVALAVLAVAACGYAAWDYHRVSQIYLQPANRGPGWGDPLPRIRGSWLFRSQARFAELTITPLTRANAAWTFETAGALLHYSPEPRVIEKVIDSAVMLGQEDQALLQLARFRAAFPDAYAAWSQVRPQKPAP